MLSKGQAREIVNRLTSCSRNYATVSIKDNGERLTRFANSEIHQNVEIEDVIISLTVYGGKKEATCSVNVYDSESLKKLAADADAILENLPDGEFDISSLKTFPLAEGVPDTVNDVRLSKAFGIHGRVETVKQLAESLDPDFTAAGVLSLDCDMRVFGSSDGVFLYHAMDYVNFEAVVTHKDGAAGFGAMISNTLEGCGDISSAFKTACDKAKMSIGPAPADIGAYTVVLEPAAMAELVSYVAYGLNGKEFLSGESYASGKLGEKLLGENVTIRDDVNNPLTFQCYFDAEGHRRAPVTLIGKGVAKTILHDSKTALKAGHRPTGHAVGNRGNGGYPFNLVMEGGDSSLNEMIASTQRGILVTRFHYTNLVNPAAAQVTGLTRDGTFMIENGKIAYPIRNMRFTQSMLEAFCHITALSRDRERIALWGGPGLIPAAKIECFHFTSGQK